MSVEERARLVLANFMATQPPRIKARWSLLPWRALESAALCMTVNQKKHPGEEWRVISAVDHYDAAMRHLSKRGHMDDDCIQHTVHAAIRLLMLAEVEL